MPPKGRKAADSEGTKASSATKNSTAKNSTAKKPAAKGSRSKATSGKGPAPVSSSDGGTNRSTLIGNVNAENGNNDKKKKRGNDREQIKASRQLDAENRRLDELERAQALQSKRKRDQDGEPAQEEPKAKKRRDSLRSKKQTPKNVLVRDEEASASHPDKKAASEDAPQKPHIRGLGARGVSINEVPSTELDVFVFGEGTSGELGLGSRKYDGGKKPIDVRRPRINKNLEGVVAIACGGMHAIALTRDQTVLTWGVNDDKALGRDTFWEGGTRSVDKDDDDDDDDDDEDETGLNPRESTPGPVDLGLLPEGTKITQVAATDSASFVLTDDGWVYGWGTFRGSDGVIGFSKGTRIQATPVLIPELKHITKLACGSNHVLALDMGGKVFTWGSGGQFQLGRRPLSRLGGPSAGLNPQPCGRFNKSHRAVRVGAGSYHSFYVDNLGRVWAWGLNNYAQTGLHYSIGQDDAMILQPQIVESLENHGVVQIVGGEHHSVACTNDGQLLTWGRVDGHQVGHPSALYTEDNAIFDDSHKPRILLHPTAIDGIKTTFVATGTDSSFALDAAGKVYSWGFSANYQTGQGVMDDFEVPTMIDNSAIRDRRIVWAGAGGQFSVVAAAKGDNMPNGH
ncbi:regulator of chromosome condensation 1/beta-lactamase-inhibitor protein II [Hypoxylon fuscum]|nr:regulator of chromosome condensation 1/beta-lactamase-inhibitor protein II [Hypoxylon fuscum]